MDLTQTGHGDDPFFRDHYKPFFSSFLVEGQLERTITYSVNSFDLAFAFIGGYSALIWQILGFLLGGYQAFSYDRLLVRRLFTEEKKQRPDHHIEENDADEVIATVLNR